MHVLFLWAGLPFIALGALIILSEARAKRDGVVVPGRLVGFSQHKGDSDLTYRAVAEYVGIDGRRRLIESPVGSSAPLGQVGDSVRVLLDPVEPESAVFKSSATYFIGTILALFGAVSCAIFFATFRADPFTVVTSVGVTALVAYKLHDTLGKIPTPMRDWLQLIRRATRGRVVSAESRDQIAWADTAALETAARRQQRMTRYAWPVLLLGGAGLLILALYLYRETNQFLARAVPAAGRVVELAENNSSDGVTYAPVVEFEDRGERHRFKDSVSSNPASYRAGDVVRILYVPEDPRRARIDRGIWNRALPILIGAFGALLGFGGVWIRLRRTSAP